MSLIYLRNNPLPACRGIERVDRDRLYCLADLTQIRGAITPGRTPPPAKIRATAWYESRGDCT